MSARRIRRGWEVLWHDIRGLAIDENGDLHPDACAETREDYATKREALARARQVLSGGWDVFGAVHVRSFEDWTDRMALAHVERDYIGDLLEVS